jgi:catechol 2,3-dioxygenase-like lactoylglutathione lyase family enzyme
MIRGIHHIGIHTGDLDRLRSFYEEAFGFEAVGEEINLGEVPEAALVIGMERTVARCLMMKAHNCFIELFEWADPVGDHREPLKANDLGYTHFMVDVEDIEAEYERLSALGMTFVGPAPVRFGNNASIYGRDPDGHIIEIGQIPAGEDLHLAVTGQEGSAA